MNANKQLFYYGFKANIKKALAKGILFIGFIVSMIALLSFGFTAFVICLVLSLGLAIYVYITAESERFDYKRQSGQIIHRGDW